MGTHSQLLPYYFGYLKDPADSRDFSIKTFENPSNFTPLQNSRSETEIAKQETVKQNRRFAEVLNEKFDINNFDATQLLPKYDIVNMLTKVRNQLSLGSCTAFAGSCPVEYISKTINNNVMQMSTLYTYKLTRNLMKRYDNFTATGDTGAFLRSTVRSLAMYGFVTEKDYPYIISEFDKTISEDLKETGQFYQALRYLRVDHKLVRGNRLQVLTDLKKWAYYEVPIIFGFTCWDSCLKQAEQHVTRGKIPFPDPTALQNEKPSGGHAVSIVGYDDNMIINNFSSDRTRLLSKTKGAFIIRNSWGSWGNVLSVDGKNYQGYGYLPYEYVLKNMANDFWVLLSQEFLDLKQFEE